MGRAEAGSRSNPDPQLLAGLAEPVEPVSLSHHTPSCAILTPVPGSCSSGQENRDTQDLVRGRTWAGRAWRGRKTRGAGPAASARVARRLDGWVGPSPLRPEWQMRRRKGKRIWTRLQPARLEPESPVLPPRSRGPRPSWRGQPIGARARGRLQLLGGFLRTPRKRACHSALGLRPRCGTDAAGAEGEGCWGRVRG